MIEDSRRGGGDYRYGDVEGKGRGSGGLDVQMACALWFFKPSELVQSEIGLCAGMFIS